MSYINPFAYNQPSYIPPQYQGVIQGASQQPQPPQNSGINWVQGEAGAKSFALPVNSAVLLLDSDEPYVYIKTTDAIGRATLSKFKLIEEKPATPAAATDYITREEFKDFKTKLDSLWSLVNSAPAQPQPPAEQEG